jgi:YD repeat-containing protein
MSRLVPPGLFLLVAALFFQSKTLSEKPTYTIYINFEDYSVRADVLYDDAKVKPRMFRTYYWYMNNDIKNTEGSFDGKLLHGEYKSFYRNYNLREQGNFNYGLKTGKWQTWFINGKIHELLQYKNGLQQGLQEVYDDQGNIVSRTDFKNGKQNGKMIFYKNNTIDTVITYKNGLPRLTKTRLQAKNKKQKDSLQKGNTKTNQAKDTVTNTPKSSFLIKKVFNKKTKKSEQTKSEGRKEIPEKKKKSPDKDSNKKS